VHRDRHRLEHITLYRLVQQHAASFIAHTQASTGAELPRFVIDGFAAVLGCGVLARGFLTLSRGESVPAPGHLGRQRCEQGSRRMRDPYHPVGRQPNPNHGAAYWLNSAQ